MKKTVLEEIKEAKEKNAFKLDLSNRCLRELPLEIGGTSKSDTS